MRDAPAYLGMDKNRFNREVRPNLIALRVGVQGVAFDRVDLDAWADKIKLLPVKDARPAYPLSREEQAALFQELPDDLARMSLFNVNTGTRESQASCGQMGRADRRTGAGRVSQSQSPLLEAHVWPPASRGGRVIRGLAGLARSQEWTDHHALFGGRACEPHCRGGEGLRRQLPQIPAITLLRRKAR